MGNKNLVRSMWVSARSVPANTLLRLAQPGRLRFPATERTSPVCFRKESESTMSNEKPKRVSVTPPGNTFGIGCRPRNWLEAVILLSLREWNSYGYELMGERGCSGSRR